MTGLGTAVLHFRELRGWTQEQTALRAGVDRTQLSRLEQETGGMSLPSFARLCVALDLSDSQKAELLDLAAGEVVGG